MIFITERYSPFGASKGTKKPKGRLKKFLSVITSSYMWTLDKPFKHQYFKQFYFQKVVFSWQKYILLIIKFYYFIKLSFTWETCSRIRRWITFSILSVSHGIFPRNDKMEKIITIHPQLSFRCVLEWFAVFWPKK